MRIKGILHIDNEDAMTSDIWNKEEWDAILILGPLYHIIKKEKRRELLKKAKSVLKPGGMVFSAFMSRSAAVLYGLKHFPEGINYPDGVNKLWQEGTDENFVEATKWFTNAYFSFPGEINPLISSAGLKPLHLVGIEGIFGENMHLFHQLPPGLQKKWKQFIFAHCEDEQMIQNSKHFLSVATVD